MLLIKLINISQRYKLLLLNITKIAYMIRSLQNKKLILND